MSDDVPGAIVLTVPYRRETNRVRVTIQLDRDGKPVAERSFEALEADASTIARQVVRAVLELLPRE